MANPYRGEVTVSVAGRAYTLRPTFQILCEIEERVGLNLPMMARRIAAKGLLASEILMVLAVATRHDGSAPFDSAKVLDMPADSVNLHGLMPAFARFFAEAVTLGESDGETAEVAYATLMEAAYAVLRLTPQEFWSLTPPEYRILLRRARQGQGGASHAAPQPQEIAQLMARFPDAEKHAVKEMAHGG